MNPEPPASHAQRLQQAWLARGALARVLLPLAAVFGALTALRRSLYRIGWLHSHALPATVIVVGNLIAGGVGHETDVTLADLAADLRAPTPTAAAELVAPMRQDCLDALDAITQAMQARVHLVLDTQAQRLDRAAMRLSRPGQGVRQQAQRVALLAHRLASHMPQATKAQRTRLDRLESDLRHRVAMRFAASEHQLDGLGARLRALDPKQVLARGYAWLSDGAGRAVVSVDGLAVGVSLQAVLSDGEASVQVTQVVRRTSS